MFNYSWEKVVREVKKQFGFLVSDYGFKAESGFDTVILEPTFILKGEHTYLRFFYERGIVVYEIAPNNNLISKYNLELSESHLGFGSVLINLYKNEEGFNFIKDRNNARSKKFSTGADIKIHASYTKNFLMPVLLGDENEWAKIKEKLI